MDPFAFNGGVVGLDFAVPAAAAAAPTVSSSPAAAAAPPQKKEVVAPKRRARSGGDQPTPTVEQTAAAGTGEDRTPLRRRSAEVPGKKAVRTESSGGAAADVRPSTTAAASTSPSPAKKAGGGSPFSIGRATDETMAKSGGAMQRTAKPAASRRSSSTTETAKATVKPAEDTAASPVPLKSALKATSRIETPQQPHKERVHVVQPARNSGSTNESGLRALAAQLTAPPPADDADADNNTSSAAKGRRAGAADVAAGAEDADDDDPTTQRKASEREARHAAVKAKVKEAKAALDKRKKMVSVREPDATPDPDAARDRLFGAPDKPQPLHPPSSSSGDADAPASEETSVSDNGDHASSSDVDSDDDAKQAPAAATEGQSATEALPEATELASLLHRRLARGVEAMGIARLTRVQRLAWEPMVGPNDVLIRSETGSGKTLAYGLPVLHKLLNRCDENPINRETGTVVIVLTPTRELAEQCSTVLSHALRKAPYVVVGAIHGGEDRHKEKARLRKGVHILVCTPGRLLDHLQTSSAFVHRNLHTIVMDEADRLLDMGFERSISGIMQIVHPVKRALVSATITNAVERLSHFTLSNPIRVGETEDKYDIPTSLRQHYTIVPCKHRLVALTAVLMAQLEAAARKIIVFVATSDATEFLYLLYSRLRSPFQQQGAADGDGGDAAASRIDRNAAAALARRGAGVSSAKKAVDKANRHVHEGGDAEDVGAADTAADGGVATAIASAQRSASRVLATKNRRFSSTAGNLDDNDALLKSHVFKLHGNMTQVDRTSVFNAFRTCDRGVLFCTDVAARGLDMPAISWIVHYDPPADDRSYVHRIGRTARIGNTGDSLLMLMDHEREFATEYLPQTTETTIREKPLPVLMYHLSRLDGNSPSWADSAAKLQRAASTLVKQDETLYRVAMFAYRSHVRAYAAYPREVKPFFDKTKLHLGQLADSFAMDSSPSDLRRMERRYVEEDRKLGRDRDRYLGRGGGGGSGGGGRGDGAEGGAAGGGGVRKKAQVQLDTRETYHSTLASKAARTTKDWIDTKREQGDLYKTISHSKTAEFDA